MPTTITLLTDLAKVVQAAFGGQEKIHSVTATTAATTIDLADGNIQTLVLETGTTLSLIGAVNGVSCSLVLKVRQDLVGGHVLTLPTILWPGAAPPTLPTDASVLSKLVLETEDGGTTWEGNVAGLGYA